MAVSVEALLDPISLSRGYRLIDGGVLKTLVKLLGSPATGIVALAGGGQVNATPLPAFINEVDTVVTNADSVSLPPATPGQFVIVNNNTAQTLQVFGLGADTITPTNTVTPAAAATGAAQNATLAALYFCAKAGNWKQFTSFTS